MNRFFGKVMTSAVLFAVIVLVTAMGSPVMAQEAGASGASATTPPSVVYTCQMHQDMKSEKPGTCVKCGMTLVRMVAPIKAVEYELKLETMPSTVKPGEPLQLGFLIFDVKTGEQIKRFNLMHEKLFHLFIVSHDLEYYDHIHPIQQADGKFTIETSLPKPGSYEIICDFFPGGGTPQVIQRSLKTADFFGEHRHFLPTKLVADNSLIKSVDGVRFELKMEPNEAAAGQPTLLKYYLINEVTGLPIKDLQPYLGSWGHTAILREGATDFLHSHSTKLIPLGADPSKLVSGPRISFHTFFARPGRHRIWSQFKRKDKVITVSFTIDVSRLDRLAKWNGRDWSPLLDSPIKGIDGTVRALAISGGDVYVGGDFTKIDGVSATRIAKWDGHKVSALGNGLNGSVWAIAVDGTDVYVGGDFTAAGPLRLNGIGKWNGSSWSALSTGITGCKDPYCSPAVYALAVIGKDLYAAGRFSTAGGIPASGIARWNGYSWFALGDGVSTGIYDGIVRALAVNGNTVYAGGQFITAGDVRAYNIAKWDGVGWSALGSGIRGNLEEVLALGTTGNDLYVGGEFNLAGGTRAYNLAKWNGSNWSALAIQAREGVRHITSSENNIYIAGGAFILPSGLGTKGIARWDGEHWLAVGSGVGSGTFGAPIMAIAINAGDLYVGGDSFTIPTVETSALGTSP